MHSERLLLPDGEARQKKTTENTKNDQSGSPPTEGNPTRASSVPVSVWSHGRISSMAASASFSPVPGAM
jgi:hypothetical protein